MTEEQAADRPLDRRFLLRGGAVLAGAAGATVLGAALGPTSASAADGDNLKVGLPNAGTSTTALTITPGATPALTLNNTNGPALRLSSVPVTFENDLAVGDIVGTDYGPLVGVNYGDGPENSYLLTPADLDFVPTVITVPPERILDTRSASLRGNILGGSSATPLDSAGRLKANTWIDVALAPSDDVFELGGAFVNVAIIGSLANGYLTVYPPGPRPNVSTANFQKGISIANGALASVDEVGNKYAVRIHTSQTTHVVLDLNGVIISTKSEGSGVMANKVLARRAARQAKRAAALRKALKR